MLSASLHPLARQAIVLSSRTDCYGWAFGLTKYLCYRDPCGCVRWTLDFVMPHVQTTGEYAEAIRRSVRFLEDVLAEPCRASLQEMDQFAWLPWSHRWGIKGAGPIERRWNKTPPVEIVPPDPKKTHGGEKYQARCLQILWWLHAEGDITRLEVSEES